MGKNIKLKRQSVWATFNEILDEEQLIQVIKTLEIDFSGDDIASLIRYVKHVANKFGIAQGSVKELYTTLYSYLNTPGIELPEDPQVYIQSIANRSVGNHPQHSSGITNSKVNTAPEVGKDLEKTGDEETNPEIVVFTYFLQRLLLHFPLDRTELLEEVALLVKKERSFSELDKEQITGWSQEPEVFLWNFTPTVETMSNLVHLCYTIFCDFLGPVEADELFHQVLDDCKQLPAAKKFNPKNFL